MIKTKNLGIKFIFFFQKVRHRGKGGQKSLKFALLNQLPRQKIRSETMPNRKSVLKLDDTENSSCIFQIKLK